MIVPDIIKQAARDLRKNMTPAEKNLWEYIKSGKLEGKNFLKQKPIFMFEEDSGFPGYVIADFICLEYKLIIEIDGNIHYTPEVLELDLYKQEMLLEKGFTVLRFRNEEILNNIDKVLSKIAASFL
ncbi:endonuclease domain-containing protein [Candidatus Gracilibacteria bacterium]|nr:endonuclease domain-containing protein [Candidatus Gracilibacteria bacterium]